MKSFMLHGLLVRVWTLLIIIIAGVLPAEVLTVSPDGPTTSIKVAIASANDGDEIIVMPGVYLERSVDFGNKNINLHSVDPTSPSVVAATVIDAQNINMVIEFGGGEDETCRLAGFTLRNGRVSHAVGVNRCPGIEGRGTLATIEYNVITSNTAVGVLQPGSGIYFGGTGGGINDCDGLIQYNTVQFNYTDENGGGLRECDGLIRHNVITSNTASTLLDGITGRGGGLHGCDGIVHGNIISQNIGKIGGGAFFSQAEFHQNIISNNFSSRSGGGGLFDCDGLIEQNIIAYNVAFNDGGGGEQCNGSIINNFIFKNSANFGGGGGLFNCRGRIENNTILYNDASNPISGQGGGLAFCQNGIIQNNIIWGNTASVSGFQIFRSEIPNFCLIQDWMEGGEGNITSAPLFIDASIDDYRLLPSSPGIDAGTTNTLPTDFDGDPRPYDMPGIGFDGPGLGVDIGADEYIPLFFSIREYILGKRNLIAAFPPELNTNGILPIDASDLIQDLKNQP